MPFPRFVILPLPRRAREKYYDLPDHHGKHRTLSELEDGDPLVLILSRGGFCPKERRQHEGLLALHRETQVGYCRLVNIAINDPLLMVGMPPSLTAATGMDALTHAVEAL